MGHAALGRDIVARIPNQPPATAAIIRDVTVVGGGLMGMGITLALLNAGLDVTLVEPREDQLDKARSAIAASIERDAAKGRITSAVARERIERLRTTTELTHAANAQLFIEAVYEDMAVKREVFTALDRVAPHESILASNTSTLDLDAIAAVTGRPDRVVGLHFFSPANLMRLLEVVRGARTSPETLATAMAFAKAIGKVGVVAGVCDGFIGNRIFEEYLRQAYFLIEEGALPQQVDLALETWGMAMGPFRTMDLAGQDIGWSIRKRRKIAQPERPYSAIPDQVCELGRFGQKTRAGFYLYPDGRTPVVDPAIDALVVAESTRLGLTRASLSDDEIVNRCIFAMINEGARVVGEGIAYRPVDVDVVYLNGYGFPAARGGPMFHADEFGLPAVLAAIERYAAGRHGWAWEPAPLLRELVARGGSFAELNR